MYRTVDTCTWDDPWVTELEPLDKLLFFYLLTNRRSTACGAYEITLRAIAFETGLTTRRVMDGLARLRPKIIWWPTHQVVFVRNFFKHQAAQSNRATFTASAQKKLLDFPPEVRAVVVSIYPDLRTDGDDFDTHPLPTPLPPPTVGGKETVTVEGEVTVEVEGESRARASGKSSPPSSFPISDERYLKAKQMGWKGTRQKLEEQRDQFLDYYTAKGEKRVDWEASWRTWVRKAIGYGDDQERMNGYASTQGQNGAGRRGVETDETIRARKPFRPGIMDALERAKSEAKNA